MSTDLGSLIGIFDCEYSKVWKFSNHPTPTLTNGNNHTPRVFSTKTQDFTPMFLKPVVEVQLFLLGSELSKDKNSESPSFKHFRPETSVGELLKVLQIFSTNKLVTENNLQNFEYLSHRGLWTKMLETWAL